MGIFFGLLGAGHAGMGLERHTGMRSCVGFLFFSLSFLWLYNWEELFLSVHHRNTQKDS